MEWEDHFSCVHRSKIIRQIYQMRESYDKLKEEGDGKKVFSEKDSIYLTIVALEDLLR